MMTTLTTPTMKSHQGPTDVFVNAPQSKIIGPPLIRTKVTDIGDTQSKIIARPLIQTKVTDRDARPPSKIIVPQLIRTTSTNHDTHPPSKIVKPQLIRNTPIQEVPPIPVTDKQKGEKPKVLFKSKFWDYVDPNKKEKATKIMCDKPKKYNPDEVKSFMGKQKEERRLKQLAEYNERQKELDKKKKQLLALNEKCKSLATKSSVTKLKKPPASAVAQVLSKPTGLPVNLNAKIADLIEKSPPSKDVGRKLGSKGLPQKSAANLHATHLLEEFEAIVKRECINYFSMSKQVEPSTVKLDKAVETTSSLCLNNLSVASLSSENPVDDDFRDSDKVSSMRQLQPDRNKAATTIQAAFKGYKVRKTLKEAEILPNNKRLIIVGHTSFKTLTEDMRLKKRSFYRTPEKPYDVRSKLKAVPLSPATSRLLNDFQNAYIPPPQTLSFSPRVLSSRPQGFSPLGPSPLKMSRSFNEPYPKEVLEKLQSSSLIDNPVPAKRSVSEMLRKDLMDLSWNRELIRSTSSGEISLRALTNKANDFMGPGPSIAQVVLEKVRLLTSQNERRKFEDVHEKVDKRVLSEIGYDSEFDSLSSITGHSPTGVEVMSHDGTITDENLGPSPSDSEVRRKNSTPKQRSKSPLHRRVKKKRSHSPTPYTSVESSTSFATDVDLVNQEPNVKKSSDKMLQNTKSTVSTSVTTPTINTTDLPIPALRVKFNAEKERLEILDKALKATIQNEKAREGGSKLDKEQIVKIAKAAADEQIKVKLLNLCQERPRCSNEVGPEEKKLQLTLMKCQKDAAKANAEMVKWMVELKKTSIEEHKEGLHQERINVAGIVYAAVEEARKWIVQEGMKSRKTKTRKPPATALSVNSQTYETDVSATDLSERSEKCEKDVPAMDLSDSSEKCETDVPPIDLSDSSEKRETDDPAMDLSEQRGRFATDIPEVNLSERSEKCGTDVPATDLSERSEKCATDVPAADLSEISEKCETDIPATDLSERSDTCATDVPGTDLSERSVKCATDVPATDLSQTSEKCVTDVPATDLSETSEKCVTDVPATDLSEPSEKCGADVPPADLSERSDTCATDVPGTDLSERSVKCATDVPATELSQTSEKCVTDVPATELSETSEKCVTDVPATDLSETSEKCVTDVPATDLSEPSEKCGADVPPADLSERSEKCETDVPAMDLSERSEKCATDVPGTDLSEISDKCGTDVPEADLSERSEKFETDVPGTDLSERSKKFASDIPATDLSEKSEKFETDVPAADLSERSENFETDVPTADLSERSEKFATDVHAADLSEKSEKCATDVPGTDLLETSEKFAADVSAADLSEKSEKCATDVPGTDLLEISVKFAADVPSADLSEKSEKCATEVPGTGLLEISEKFATDVSAADLSGRSEKCATDVPAAELSERSEKCATDVPAAELSERSEKCATDVPGTDLLEISEKFETDFPITDLSESSTKYEKSEANYSEDFIEDSSESLAMDSTGNHVIVEIEDDEALKLEAAKLHEEEKRIESEIRELEAIQSQQNPITAYLNAVEQDKPPPPYSPPSSESLSYSSHACYISVEKEKVDQIIEKVVDNAWDIWCSTKDFHQLSQIKPEYLVEDEDPTNIEGGLTSWAQSSFDALVSDLALDGIKTALNLDDLSTSLVDRLRRGPVALQTQKLKLPKTKDALLKHVHNSVVEHMPRYLLPENMKNVHMKKPSSRWCVRPRDMVEEMLVEGMIDEEPLWTEIWPEELTVIDNISQKILRNCVADVINNFKISLCD